MNVRPGRLDGKACLITGGARGIGEATARRFVREGARLVVSDIDAEALAELGKALEAEGGDIRTVVGDVSRPGDARRMVAAAVDAYGGLDVLVANAGVIPLHEITEATADDWDRVMSVDGRGMFLTCKYAIEAMLVGGRGALVLLSSISGLAGQRGQSTYGPAKFVASGLTMHLAVEWADRGIRVNAVAPGTVRTDRVRRLPDEPGGPEYLAAIERRHPLGRIGEPEEVAAAICFLASDEASFITGTVLPVDGGYLAQ
ncbi:SDR family NAD(P)-dependent oxidoreductase [Streptomyces sp. G45]|uniref:SDR family NAD(P)-dependent oxidoreductase n=1 Tax=Streptomyces sp. G45 TaxID=3406627 RepID=UPI003C2A282A